MIDEDKYGTISSFESSLETSFPPVSLSLLLVVSWKKLHVNKILSTRSERNVSLFDKLSWNLIIEREIRKDRNKFKKSFLLYFIL